MKASARRLAYGWLVIGLWFVGLHAQSDGDSGVRTKLMALENVWNNAEKERDVGALRLILDEGMVYIDEDGSLLTKEQFLENTRKTGPQLQTLVTEAVSVHVFGETAVVAGTYRVSGTARGKAYRRAGRFIDTWYCRNGKWVCVAAQSTPMMGTRGLDQGELRARAGNGG